MVIFLLQLLFDAFVVLFLMDLVDNIITDGKVVEGTSSFRARVYAALRTDRLGYVVLPVLGYPPRQFEVVGQILVVASEHYDGHMHREHCSVAPMSPVALAAFPALGAAAPAFVAHITGLRFVWFV